MKTCGRCGTKHANVEEVRACYNRPMPERTTGASEFYNGELPSTTRQQDFAFQLLRQLGRDDSSLPKPLERYGVREISPLIDQLLEEVRVKPVTGPAEARSHDLAGATVEAGMYRRPEDGAIFKVQTAVHGSGRLYAKRLRVVREAERDDEGDIVLPGKIAFDYKPGAIALLKPEYRMTMEQAAEFGALYGTCVRCGRTLTKEKSIERSMGPICAEKM